MRLPVTAQVKIVLFIIYLPEKSVSTFYITGLAQMATYGALNIVGELAQALLDTDDVFK